MLNLTPGADLLIILSALLFQCLFSSCGQGIMCGADKKPQVVEQLRVNLDTKLVFFPHFLANKNQQRYLTYGVSATEGFNLRLDVFIRVANLVQILPKAQNWTLVLPPWEHLDHWTSPVKQDELSWTTFFDLENLKSYLQVLEMKDFLTKDRKKFDEVFVLQNDGRISWNGERLEEAPCLIDPGYYRDVDGLYKGLLTGVDISSEGYKCLSVHGTAKVLLEKLSTLPQAKSVFIDRFEEVLHIHYGQKDYWEARRSLVFAKHLRDEGDKFRQKHLQSNDKDDETVLEDDWRKNHKKEGTAKGGPYLAVHLRRGDFLYAHPDKVPSLDSVVKQIKKLLKKHKLKKVYLATDADRDDVKYLKSKLPLFKYAPPKSILEKYGDGGVAIIDQWICAHARIFTGTCESTFSFRIHEERDILGFHPDNTFNCLCGDKEEGKCEQPTRWRIVYD